MIRSPAVRFTRLTVKHKVAQPSPRFILGYCGEVKLFEFQSRLAFLMLSLKVEV
jgi:hypothetical protein